MGTNLSDDNKIIEAIDKITGIIADKAQKGEDTKKENASLRALLDVMKIKKKDIRSRGKFDSLSNNDLGKKIFEILDVDIFKQENKEIRTIIESEVSSVDADFSILQDNLNDVIDKCITRLPEKQRDDFRTYCVELLRRNMDELYRFYIPNTVCEEYLNMWKEKGIVSVLFSARNGIGKSTLAVNMVAHVFWKSDNPYFDIPIIKNWHKSWSKNAVFIVPSSTNEATFHEKVIKYFPSNRYWEEKDAKGRVTYHTDTGWKFKYMSHLQYKGTRESHDFSLIVVDEPTDAKMWDALMSRLRTGGICIALGTIVDDETGEQYDHLYDTYVKFEGKEYIEKVINGNVEKFKNNFRYIDRDTHDACMDCFPNNRGHLRHVDYENMRALTSSAGQVRYDTRVSAYNKSTNLAFPDFDRDVHIVPRFELNKTDFCVLCGYDIHHDRYKPDCIGWIAIDRNNKIYVCKEYTALGDQRFSDPLSHKIMDIERNWSVYYRQVDSYSKLDTNRNPEAVTHIERMNQNGVYFDQNSGSKRGQCDRAIEYCLAHEKDKDGNIIREPILKVFDDCHNFINGFETTLSVEENGKRRTKKNKKDNLGEDFMELLGRLCVMRMDDDDLFISLSREKILNQPKKKKDAWDRRKVHKSFVENKYSSIIN